MCLKNGSATWSKLCKNMLSYQNIDSFQMDRLAKKCNFLRWELEKKNVQLNKIINNYTANQRKQVKINEGTLKCVVKNV